LITTLGSLTCIHGSSPGDSLHGHRCTHPSLGNQFRASLIVASDFFQHRGLAKATGLPT
jgi:hypothetical protein